MERTKARPPLSFVDENSMVESGKRRGRRTLVSRHVAAHSKFQRKQRLENENPRKRESATEPFQEKPEEDEQKNHEHGALTRQAPMARTSSTSSPIEYALPAGRVDPFNALSIPITNTRDLELIDYLTNVIWPQFSDLESNGVCNPFPARWLRRGYDNPALMHAFLTASSSHIEARLPTSTLDQRMITEQLAHENEAFKLLRKQLEDPNSANIEDLLMVIVCLASNQCRQSKALAVDPKPFTPPLESANWLNIYGSWDFSGPHWNAIVQLVGRIGGLDQIREYGLPWVISYADVLLAASSLRKPKFPAASPTGKNLRFEKLEEFSVFPWKYRKAIGYGSAFDCISALKYPGYEPAHMDTFRDLGNFSGTLHAYHEGLLRQVRISRIADSRNKLTHQIFSLPHAKDLEFSTTNGTISDFEYHNLEVYEACRLTAVLYTLMVIFPMPRSKHARDYLIPLIRDALNCIDPYRGNKDVCGLYFWCLVVAGVAATGYPIRDWYLQRLVSTASFLQIYNWDEAEKFLERFAWLQCACHQAGECLWTDAHRS